MTEDQLQAKCHLWTWNTYPQLRRCYWHIPNGKGRSKLDAIQLQAMGVIPGVFDIGILWQCRYYIVDFKVGTNQLSQPQELYRTAMIAQGAISCECRSEQEWRYIIEVEVLRLRFVDEATMAGMRRRIRFFGPTKWP